MLARALPVTTKLIQVGSGRARREVTISTVCPVARGVRREAGRPSMRAASQVFPMSVWTAYAKSTGVAPRASSRISPAGVNTNTVSGKRSTLTCSMNSTGSPAVFCISRISCIQVRARRWATLLRAFPSLYRTWAAIPDSAISCISLLRICTSIGSPRGPNSTVCSDW